MPNIIDHTLHIDAYSEALPRLAQPAAVHVWSVPLEYRASGYYVSLQLGGQPIELPACDYRDAAKIARLELDADPDAAAAAELETLRAGLVPLNNARYESAVLNLTSAYPRSEIDTWGIQREEVAAWKADNTSPTPWIDIAAADRGISRDEYLARTYTKAVLYKAATASLTGRRQRYEAEIKAAAALEQLQAVVIDYTLPSA